MTLSDEWESEPVITFGELIDMKTKMKGVPLRFKRSDWKKPDTQDDDEYKEALSLWKNIMDQLEVEDYPMTCNKPARS